MCGIKTNKKCLYGIMMIVIAILSLVLFLNCSANRMGIFDIFRKKKAIVTKPQDKQDKFTVFSIEGESLPIVGTINERFANNKGWEEYPWNCSVVVRCKNVNDAALPTEEESCILNNLEDSLNNRIIADPTNPNALFFGRVNWNSTRELIWKVKNPEPVAAFLQSVIDDKNAIREIDFKIENDKEWKLTEMYSTGINKTGLTYMKFETWLDSVMQMNIPSDVVAFCFNLYEDEDETWTLELIGASTFDKDDSDWACDEVFTTRDNPLIWHDNKDWKNVLNESKSIIKEYLQKGKYRKELKGRQGLAVGFVDGDLVLL